MYGKAVRTSAMVQAYRADTENAGAGPQPVSRFRAMRRKLTSDPGIWRRGILLALCSVLLTVVLVLHSDIPNTIGNTGSLIETFLPWFGLFVPVLLILGLLRRSATAVIALVLPVAVWLNLFGGLLFADKSGAGGDLTVATHNVNAGNPDPRAPPSRSPAPARTSWPCRNCRAARWRRTRTPSPTGIRTTPCRAPWDCGASTR